MLKRKLIKQIRSTLKMNGANAHNLKIAHGYVFLKYRPCSSLDRSQELSHMF